MTIEAKIVCDSVGPNGVRITTFVLRYPRFIHSEFMTHRDFSRNASSSRAIPIEKQIDMIIADPAMPLEFRKNKKGMQAGEALDEKEQQKAVICWINAMNEAIVKAHGLIDLGVHKQYVNRLLEPFAHISVVVTSTRFANFFALRHHSAAQPEIAELAKKMWKVYQTNLPDRLQVGEWHLPFITREEWDSTISTETLIKCSVARCARVSYLTHEGKEPNQEEDFALYDRLLADQPIHASPAEHQAKALKGGEDEDGFPTAIDDSGNFNGWIQYRQTLKNQYITEFKEPLG